MSKSRGTLRGRECPRRLRSGVCGPRRFIHGRRSPTATAEKTWDASQWVPTERIEPLLTTEAEKERAYREQVARHAQGAGMPAPPQV
ncbi:hypothetical protein D9B87_12365, partial [Corynebacterium diphtheriae]